MMKLSCDSRRAAKTGFGLGGALLFALVPAAPATELPREKIVYASFRPTNTDLYLVNGKGRGVSCPSLA